MKINEQAQKTKEFADQVHIDKNTGFIGGYIPTTKILIEQKSIDKDLRKGNCLSIQVFLLYGSRLIDKTSFLSVTKYGKTIAKSQLKHFLKNAKSLCLL